MGKKIHTRIFFPVLLIILSLTLVAWFTFSMTSKWYVKYMAERDCNRMIHMIEELAEEVYQNVPEPEFRTLEEDRKCSKELLKSVKQSGKIKRTKGKLLIFNLKLKQVYPVLNTMEKEESSDKFAFYCMNEIKTGELKAGVGKEIEVENESWYLNLFKVEAKHNIRAGYFVVAVPMIEVSVLWNYTGKLLAVISIVFIGIASILIWLVARSIAHPLKQLCSQARAIGEGRAAQIEEVYSLQELETLKEAYNQMEYKIRKAEEEKNRFFQNVSHDLRTPLASITGYAQGIQCNVMKSPQKAAEIILSESLRMTNLVESILTLTKMDNQEFQLHRMEIELEEFLEERLEALKGIAGTCKFRLEFDEDEFYIKTDPELLGRIIQNIIANCVRYAEHEITVRLKHIEQGVFICIEDDGSGFNQEDIPHLFERFYQGENGKFGIGLSVVWSGMQYLGGKVHIGNLELPGHGAFYELYLPLNVNK